MSDKKGQGGQEETPLIADESSRGLSKYPSPAKLSPEWFGPL
jgi:hypothetical protein